MKKTMIVILVLSSFLTVQTFADTGEHQRIKQDVIKALKDRGSVLYIELLALKSEERFIDLGFDDPAYKQWDTSAQKLNDECVKEVRKLPAKLRTTSELLPICTASNNLHKIGLRYAKYKGKDDEYTLPKKEEIEAVFLKP
jgi:hypothetical protein